MKLSIEEGLALILFTCAAGVDLVRYASTGDSGSGLFIYTYRTLAEALPLGYLSIKKGCEAINNYSLNRNANKLTK